MPGDFDGDGGMDILVTIEDVDEKPGLEARILWGNHSDDQHRMVCIEDQPASWLKTLDLTHEPLVFDYDYDYVSDLLVVGEDGNRTVIRFPGDRTANTTTIQLISPRREQLKKAHSNAHIDINSDGLPDLFLTTVSGIELYERKHTASNGTSFEYHSHIAWPRNATMNGCTPDKCVGQVVFADFSLTGTLDLIVPVCFDPECKSSNLYLVPLDDLWLATSEWMWEPMSLDLMDGQLNFNPPSPGDEFFLLFCNVRH